VAIFKIEQNIFQTFKHRRGPRPIATALRLIDKHVNPIGLTCLKTPNAKHLEKVPRPDPGAALYTCKKLLHSIFQYKIPQMLMDLPDSAKRSR
jgi:hypothetical protein